MTEKQARNKLYQMGYRLKKKSVPTLGNLTETRYAIVNSDNVLVAGEYIMDWEDVLNWINE